MRLIYEERAEKLVLWLNRKLQLLFKVLPVLLSYLFDISQLEDAKQEGRDQEKKEDDSQQQIPDEENGIEMSENFEGALHDVEAGKEEDEENEEGNGDEDDVDKQMGEVDGQDTEKLDEKIWGDSDDEEEKEVDEEHHH